VGIILIGGWFSKGHTYIGVSHSGCRDNNASVTGLSRSLDLWCQTSGLRGGFGADCKVCSRSSQFATAEKARFPNEEVIGVSSRQYDYLRWNSTR
jgi:hypothetical protein